MTAAEIRAKLRKYEYLPRQYGGGSGAQTPYMLNECVFCGGDRLQGHTDDCVMAEILKEEGTDG